MTAEEFSAALAELGISQSRFADLIDTPHRQVVNRWASGATPVPGWVPLVLQLLRERSTAPASSNMPPTT